MLNAVLLATLGSPIILQRNAFAEGTSAAPTPFRVEVPQSAVDLDANCVTKDIAPVPAGGAADYKAAFA
jgi:hypothetical protein